MSERCTMCLTALEPANQSLHCCSTSLGRLLGEHTIIIDTINRRIATILDGLPAISNIAKDIENLEKRSAKMEQFVSKFQKELHSFAGEVGEFVQTLKKMGETDEKISKDCNQFFTRVSNFVNNIVPDDLRLLSSDEGENTVSLPPESGPVAGYGVAGGGGGGGGGRQANDSMSIDLSDGGGSVQQEIRDHLGATNVAQGPSVSSKLKEYPSASVGVATRVTKEVVPMRLLISNNTINKAAIFDNKIGIMVNWKDANADKSLQTSVTIKSSDTVRRLVELVSAKLTVTTPSSLIFTQHTLLNSLPKNETLFKAGIDYSPFYLGIVEDCIKSGDQLKFKYVGVGGNINSIKILSVKPRVQKK